MEHLNTNVVRRTGARFGALTFLVLAIVFTGSGFANIIPAQTEAATAAPLLSAGNFAVLAGAGITNTGNTTVTGDVGSFPTLTQTGFSGANTVTIVGTNHFDDITTQGAKTDLVTAYNNVSSQTPTVFVSADLGGQILTPGVYKDNGAPASLAITGTLTLDAQNNPNAVFIFQSASTFTMAVGSTIVLINGAQACNIFFQVGSSATLGVGSIFKGTILATESVTVNTGATILGRVLAEDGAVTLDTNTISVPTCVVAPRAGNRGRITVSKIVINDNGGTKVVSDFPLMVENISIISDMSQIFPARSNPYTISEISDSNYVATFSGDCDSSGKVYLTRNSNKTCIITNNDILQPPQVIQAVLASSSIVLATTSVIIVAPLPTIISTTTLSNFVTIPVALYTPSFPNTGFSPPSSMDLFIQYIRSTFFKIQKESVISSVADQVQGISGEVLRLKIPAIAVNALIESLGLTTDGAMRAPKGPDDVAWFNGGPRPGQQGSTVIAGHSGWTGGLPAVFDHLNKLQKGDKLSVSDEKGLISTFVVTELRVYGQDENDAEVFNTIDGKAHLNLITCGGVWNSIEQRYSQRLVVYTERE